MKTFVFQKKFIKIVDRNKNESVESNVHIIPFNPNINYNYNYNSNLYPYPNQNSDSSLTHNPNPEANCNSCESSLKSIELFVNEEVGIGHGGCCWDGAIALAAFLADYFYFQTQSLNQHQTHLNLNTNTNPKANIKFERSVRLSDLTVIELGSGTGLPSLMARALGAKLVLATDLKPYLTLINKNIRANGFYFQANANNNYNDYDNPMNDGNKKKCKYDRSRGVSGPGSGLGPGTELGSGTGTGSGGSIMLSEWFEFGFGLKRIFRQKSKKFFFSVGFRGAFDVILLSDVLSLDSSLYPVIIKSLLDLSDKKSLIYISYKIRDSGSNPMETDFFRSFAEKFFFVQIIQTMNIHPNLSNESFDSPVFIALLTRKNSFSFYQLNQFQMPLDQQGPDEDHSSDLVLGLDHTLHDHPQTVFTSSITEASKASTTGSSETMPSISTTSQPVPICKPLLIPIPSPEPLPLSETSLQE